jgi:tetratricopeptide (TPR) repeat protein
MDLSALLGFAAEANRYWNTMVVCEPLQNSNWKGLGYSYLYLGEVDKALAIHRHALDTLGEHPTIQYDEQLALLALGRHKEAAEVALRVPLAAAYVHGVIMRVRSAAASGRIDEARTWAESILSSETNSEKSLLQASAMLGDREVANRIAASLDARAGGSLKLLRVVSDCFCGLVFDMEVTPNFAARIAESGVPWPPPTLIDYPAKDW